MKTVGKEIKLKAFIMGHSMGGHACASFGTRFPGSADGFVLLGAITRQTSAKEGEFPIKEKPSLYIDNTFEEGLCANDMVFEDYAKDPLVKKKISIGLLNSVWEGTRFLKKNVPVRYNPFKAITCACPSRMRRRHCKRKRFKRILW